MALLEVEGLHTEFHTDEGVVEAMNGVDLALQRGETLGLVGESGCGKSTLRKTILGLLRPTEGEVYYDGERIDTKSDADLRALRQEMQIVFQDQRPASTRGGASVTSFAARFQFTASETPDGHEIPVSKS